MTRVSLLRWKSNTNAPQKDAKQAESSTGTLRSCAQGDPHHKLDWQGGSVPAPGHAPLKSWKGITCFRDEIWELPLCESFKLFKHWENKDMRCKCCKDKGETIRRESHHRREMEAEPGRAPWDGRQGDRSFLGGLTHFHPSFPQVTSSIWTGMEGGDSFRSQWSMVQNRYRHLLVKIFLTQEKKKNIRLKREIKAKLCAVFVCKRSPLKSEKWRALFCFFLNLIAVWLL